jgi:hypothetical protein
MIFFKCFKGFFKGAGCGGDTAGLKAPGTLGKRKLTPKAFPFFSDNSFTPFSFDCLICINLLT